MPGLDDNFLFTLCSWASGLRTSCYFHFASLACCHLTRKMPGCFFWWNLSWAHCTLSCCPISSGSPICVLGTSAFPLLSRFLMSPRACDTHWGRRSFNCYPWGCPSVCWAQWETAGSFHFGMVCGEGITGLGMLGAPSSLILESSSCRASQSHLCSPSCLTVVGLCLDCLPLPTFLSSYQISACTPHRLPSMALIIHCP